MHFRSKKEDDLWQVRFSERRHIDPHIMIGPLVGWAGFPLKISYLEGAKARDLQDRPTSSTCSRTFTKQRT